MSTMGMAKETKVLELTGLCMVIDLHVYVNERFILQSYCTVLDCLSPHLPLPPPTSSAPEEATELPPLDVPSPTQVGLLLLGILVPVMR